MSRWLSWLGITKPGEPLGTLGYLSGPSYGVLRYWNGTTWVRAKLRVYVNGAWVKKPLYVYKNKAWHILETD
jgi:hypothetical protein